MTDSLTDEQRWEQIYMDPSSPPQPTRPHDAPPENGGAVNTMIAAEELRLLIERAERLEEEKKGIGDDIKDVFAEAKARGFDAKAMRKIMTIRKQKKEDFEHEEAIIETYMAALGMI